MSRPLLRCLLLLAACVLSQQAAGREPSSAEQHEVLGARQEEASARWEAAAEHWEAAISIADRAGEVGRALEYGTSALADWQKLSGPSAREREAFVAGVLAKLQIGRGWLVSGRERNLAALRLIESLIVESSGWRPAPGQRAPAGVSPALLEAWTRAHLHTAWWLDAQGRTVEAVDLLNAVEVSVRGPGGQATRFYHRRLVSARASFLKFLGFIQTSIDDLRRLQETPAEDPRQQDWAPRFNLAYYSSQFLGPRPEFLTAARAVWEDQKRQGAGDRDLRRLLAKMAHAYGEAGLDIGDLDRIAAEAMEAGDDFEAVYARRDRAVLARLRGNAEGSEEALLHALAEVRKRGVKRGEPTLYREYALLLIDQGRATEGLSRLKEALRMTRQFGWTQHVPRLLATVASTQARLGDARGLEQTLRELDLLIASGKLVPERLFLAHCARAVTLLSLGRAAEGERAIARAIEIADRAGLNEFQRSALEWTREVKPITPASPVTATRREGILGLQPANTVSIAPPGEAARARFRLSNATSGAVKGTLRVRGAATRVELTENAARVTLSEGAESREVVLELAAGDSLPIDIEAPPAARARALVLEWKESGAPGDAAVPAQNRSVCQIQPDRPSNAGNAVAAITNTSLGFSNPFYAVQFYHPIYRSNGENFRAKPSVRCRVEILDGETQSVLAVDADGDGSFSGPGDFLIADDDHDGFPQLPRKTANAEPAIEVLIYPLPGTPAPQRDIRLSIEVQSAGRWTPIAHDLLKAARRK